MKPSHGPAHRLPSESHLHLVERRDHRRAPPDWPRQRVRRRGRVRQPVLRDARGALRIRWPGAAVRDLPGYADASKVPPGLARLAAPHLRRTAHPAPPPRRAWEKPYVPNLTGTLEAWRPPGSLRAEGERDRAPPATMRPGRPIDGAGRRVRLGCRLGRGGSRCGPAISEPRRLHRRAIRAVAPPHEPSPGPPPPVPPAELQREQQQSPTAAPSGATPSSATQPTLAPVGPEPAKPSPLVAPRPPRAEPTADAELKGDDSAPTVSRLRRLRPLHARSWRSYRCWTRSPPRRSSSSRRSASRSATRRWCSRLGSVRHEPPGIPSRARPPTW